MSMATTDGYSVEWEDPALAGIVNLSEREG